MNHQAQEETISYLLGSICKAQRGQLGDVLTRVGLYAGQEKILWNLWREDGLTQSHLVECLCVQPPTVSKMLDRMEKTGLLMRRPDAEDSRIMRVYLTEQGRGIEHSVCEAWAALEQRVTANLATEERLLLRRLLLQVRENLDDVPEAVEADGDC